ncbi:hypothetical protein RIF29_00689 [Crotalaria pallida]|uniref:Myb-like domain-containing protein n=1 Tax=Crotalaria pallida TaxID=3830 RepID=A0AAN9IWG0_CROPI
MATSPKLISPNDAASPTKKPQPIPWTHQETVNLIRAYQEKWYSLKRGPLRSSQWEEVAVVVAARCGYDLNHPSKSAVQCRHKMEKLRQRHRAEKHRLAAGTPGRAWQYFGLMDELERGPLPISARPLMAFLPPGDDRADNYNDDDNDYGDEDDDDNERNNYVKSKSINHIIRQRPRTNKYGGFSGFERERVPKGFWRMDDNYDDDVSDDDDDDDDDNNDDDGEKDEDKRVVVDERGLVLGLTAEIKDFGQRFTAVENLKMRMMKETERRRLEMENKRIEMILKSQRRIVDSIERVFGSSKKMKISYDI